MHIHFFENYIEKLYEENKVDTMFPDDKGNIKLCCPFPHTKKEFDPNTWEEKEISYYEKVPSSSINMNMRVFNCFTCSRTFKELEFAEYITGKDKDSILKEYVVKEELLDSSTNWRELQHKYLLENEEVLGKLRDLKISQEVIEQLMLGYMTNCLAIPVFKNNSLVNIARYNINKIPSKPKNEYNKNANSGDIVPFDIWKNDFRDTIICEGEKDMLVARSQGFNAITLTGGSQTNLQNDYLNYFKGRKVFICYDNDEAGRKGAIKRYKEISNICDVYVTDISSICIQNKEDIADFFVKYNRVAEDFINILNGHSRKPSAEELEQVSIKNEIKLSKMEDNIKNSYFRKKLKSHLQIVATCTETYVVPEYAIFRPKELGDDTKLEIKSWYLSSSHEDFLELIEGTVKSREISGILASLVGLDAKKYSKFYDIELGPLQSIYKVTVADIALENDDKASEFIIDLYSKQPLDIGNLYEIIYKLYPHPKQGRKVIAISEAIKATDYTFDTDNMESIKSLEMFKSNGVISNKINELYESARCHIAPYLNKDIWLAMELVFNSPLDITYKDIIRGALDIFILGDTRTGKSELSEKMIKLYDFGEKIPLKTATVASLIGGTDDKIKKTKLGVIPRHHKELVIMEEFSGAPMDFIKTLTEIRSSNMVKIYRVAGDIQTPCKLRMVTISNPVEGMMLSSYPNGIVPINELIKTPEDIARYDMFLLFPRVEKLTDTSKVFGNKAFEIESKHYQVKSKWVKSLTAEDIVISNDLGSYIFDRAVELNNLFESSFTVFGSETNKKIARMSAALACMLCSTNDYKNVIVTKEHVDYIIDFIKRVYDNDVFRLKEFATEERAYTTIVEEDTKKLESLYPKNVTMLEFLSNTSKVSRGELATVSGLDKDNFSSMFNVLVARKFVKLNRDMVLPTVKFRKTYRIMNKSFNLADTDGTCTTESVF